MWRIRTLDFTGIMFSIAEVIGTIAFAVSGAMIAIDRGLDLFGVVFLAITTALGGGTIRDIFLGHFPPRMFYSYQYLLISAVCAFGVFALTYFRRTRNLSKRSVFLKYVNIFDAIGLGIFSVIGVQVTVAAGYGDNAFLCIFLGMTTGCGGGIVRDLLSRETPYVLKKHIYAIASIIGSGIFYLMQMLPVEDAVEILLGAGSTILIRMLATHYKWNLPKITNGMMQESEPIQTNSIAQRSEGVPDKEEQPINSSILTGEAAVTSEVMVTKDAMGTSDRY